MKGKIKWFDPHMRYGFIVNEEGKNVYLSAEETEFDDNLCFKDGDDVEFKVESASSELIAKKIVKIK